MFNCRQMVFRRKKTGDKTINSQSFVLATGCVTTHSCSQTPEWCRESLRWNEEWYQVVFIDESRFCLGMSNGRIKKRRRRTMISPVFRGAACATIDAQARIVRVTLDRFGEVEVNLLPCPPKSSDIFLIKNVWNLMATKFKISTSNTRVIPKDVERDYYIL